MTQEAGSAPKRAKRRLEIAKAVERRTKHPNLAAAVAATPDLGVSYSTLKRVLEKGFGPRRTEQTVAALRRLGVLGLVPKGTESAP